jgi:threonine dehydrogenase-like Zn-dependent dehydrogenase
VRALVLYTGDKGVRLETDYPVPDLAEGEALIRVLRAGICNTDLELIKGYADYHGVLGHEFVGVVESCPSSPVWVGQRVVGEINISCGDCESCRAGRPSHCPSRAALGIRGHDGVFADYVALPTANLHPVPESVSDDQAALVEPLAAALAVTDQLHIRPTERVIVLGDGKLGQLIAQVLALTGCHLLVVGRHEKKLELLAFRGIEVFVADPSSPTPQTVADVVIEATGSPSGFASACHLVRPRGKLVLKSTYQEQVSADLSGIVVDEVQVIGSRCGPFAPALRLLAQGLVDVEALIETRLPLDKGVTALEMAAGKGSLKVLLET